LKLEALPLTSLFLFSISKHRIGARGYFGMSLFLLISCYTLTDWLTD
jgi:hypothetical protein